MGLEGGGGVGGCRVRGGKGAGRTTRIKLNI